MEASVPVSTPFVVKHELFSSQSPQTEARKYAYRSYVNNMHYLSLVGLLLFAIQIRPNIQYTVSIIAKFGANPSIAYLETVKCILRYLKGTADYHLTLRRCRERSFDLVGWSSSNWAQDMSNHRSTSSFVFDVAGSSVI